MAMRRIVSAVLVRAPLAALILGCSSESAPVDVPVPVTALVINAPASSVLAGQTLQLSAVPMDQAGHQLTARSSQVAWSVDNGTVASISTSGLLTGLVAGQVNVTASLGGVSQHLPLNVDNPVPQIATLTPANALAGDTTFTLRVQGGGFTAASMVRWNGGERPTTYVSAGELTARIGTPDIAGAGNASVTVFNPPPGGGSSPGVTFVVTPAYLLSIGGGGPGNGMVTGPGLSCTLTAGVPSGMCGHVFAGGTVVGLQASPALGSVFGSWSGACAGGNPSCSVTMTADRFVMATFDHLPPLVTTTPATDVTPSGATIHGTVDQDGTIYTLWWEWGTDPTLATHNQTGASDGPCPVTGLCMWGFPLGGLPSAGTFYFRVVAQNSAGTARGAILSFTTLPLP
jgi:hypothetical protein